ncbi:Uma2 family endonuclease [Chloroflexi bacterium TSY]|nr:Uma2 family endonuclease [Chloroflexi bacterium TSY]
MSVSENPNQEKVNVTPTERPDTDTSPTQDDPSSQNTSPQEEIGQQVNGPAKLSAAQSSTLNDHATKRMLTDNGADINGANHIDEVAERPTLFHDEEYQRPEKEEDDPFRYGWRTIQIVNDDGTIGYDQIPLTLEDLLHPEEEDFRMQNPEHKDTCVYLETVLTNQVADIPNAVILYDTRVDWNIPGIKPFGPDITVILEANIQPPDKGTFVADIDGIPPIMVIEVTSQTTRKQDFDEKPKLMQQARLPYYFVVDMFCAPEKRRVFGYELTSEGYYIAIRPNEQGWIWMEPVCLWVGLRDGVVECYDVDGNLMLNYVKLAENLESETQRADQEAQRAKAANEENQRLVDYLRSIGIDPETIPKA